MTETEPIVSSKESPKRAPIRVFPIFAGIVIVGLILGVGYLIRYGIWVDWSVKAINKVEAGRFKQAVQDAEEATRVMSFLPEPKSYALSLRLMSSIYACRRQFKQAERYNAALLAYDQKIWGRNSSEYAADLADLALIRRKQSRFPESEKLYREAIQIFAGLPKCEVDKARNMALLAWVLARQDKFEEALKLIAESDQIMKAKFSENSFERLVGIVEAAWISREMGNINQCHADMATAYKISIEPTELEKSSAQTVVALSLLAKMLDEEGHKDKANKIFYIAEANCKSSAFGKTSNRFMADIWDAHSKLLSELGEHEESQQLHFFAIKNANIDEPE